jgi:hypothetical protein
MDCYRDMYYKLFNTITDVINELQEVQKETEEMYLSHQVPDNILHLTPPNDDDSRQGSDNCATTLDHGIQKQNAAFATFCFFRIVWAICVCQ